MTATAKQTPERILWKGRQAAQACEISERQLWAQTQPRGPIPCVRIGNSVRYSPEALQRFIRQSESPQQTEEQFRQDITDLGGGPEDGGNHPAGCVCDACDPS